MKNLNVTLAAAALLAFTAPASAGAPPAQLHNKTIEIVWSQSNTWRRTSDNVQGSSNPTMQRQIYISSAGRPFVRQQGTSGRNAAKGDVGPEKLTGRFAFDGNTMTNFMGREGLLWRITVTFTPSFSGCSANVVIARDAKAAKVTGIDGAPYENLSATVGSTSCSMKDGNAFAG